MGFWSKRFGCDPTWTSDMGIVYDSSEDPLVNLIRAVIDEDGQAIEHFTDAFYSKINGSALGMANIARNLPFS